MVPVQSNNLRMTRQEAEDFLYAEGRLLDGGRLEEWLSLFTEDGLYWIPIVDGSNPEREPSILYDDSSRRAQRIYQLLHQPHHAQRPPSRTVHVISNVEVSEKEERDPVVVHCNLVVFEVRPGGQEQFGLGIQRFLAGLCEYRLRYESKWRIVLKKVLLIDRDLPIDNMTFII